MHLDAKTSLPLHERKILLIISGGIAAYKSLELIRLLKGSGASLQTILTKGGSQFITPLSVSALSGEKTYTDLWNLNDESDMGHIRLSRDNDLIVIAPASANMMAKMAHGLADDLASTTLLASDKPILCAPAMNGMMWSHPATQDNVNTLQQRGIHFVGPESGEMACLEHGVGRMSEPQDILRAITEFFDTQQSAPFSGRHVLVTAGPTYEAIDPVRFIGNHSSGKQGIAIAQAFAALGAHVSLICGPVEQSLLPTHKNITTINIQSGQEMLEATLSACKTHAFHIGIFSAAVADWRIKNQSDSKIKKNSDTTTPELELEANTDILKTIASKDFKDRPEIVVGFAAETDDLVHNATMKLTSKNCDVILANAVTEKDNAFGSDENKIYCLTKENQSNVTVDEWPRATKLSVAQKLAELMIRKLNSAEHLKAAE